MGKKAIAHKMLKERDLEKYKRKPEKKKAKAVTVIGKAYDLEDIEDMLGDLRSEERDKAVFVSIQFMSDNLAIKETAEKHEIELDKLEDAVIGIVQRDSQLILDVLKETKRTRALSYIVESPKFPSETKKKAEAILKEIKKPEKRFEQKKEAVPTVEAFTPAMVKALWKDLNSKDKSKQITAAISVFTNYSRIAPAMSKIPGLNVTQVVNKARDVTLRNTDPLLRQIILTWNKAALGFLATSRSIPPSLAKRAKTALKKLEPAAVEKPKPIKPTAAEIPRTIVPRPKIPEPRSELKAPEPKTKVTIGEKEITTRKPEAAPMKFDEPKVRRIWKDLNTIEAKTAIKAAIQVFTNYHDIARVLPNIPMMTISQFVGKASDVASKNMQMFFKKLSDTRNKKALEFIVKSQAVVSVELTKEAKRVLELLLRKEREGKRFEPKVTFKEGGEPGDEE